MGAVYLQPADDAMAETGLFYARFMDSLGGAGSESMEVPGRDSTGEPSPGGIEG